MSTTIDLGRPVSGDVIDLILEDHRLFERLLRDLRDSSADRDAVRRAFAALHVAHAEAEEKHVYPKMRRKDAIGEHEAEHGEEEHAEGHRALFAVLELRGTDTEALDDAVEELAELGERFAGERNAPIEAGCGRPDNVRAIVAEAERRGLLDDDADEH